MRREHRDRRAPPAARAALLGAFAAFAALAALPATAATPDAALLAAGTPCCEDPSKFGFEPLPVRGSVDFAIDRRSPLFEFQSGRSFFRAFRLPTTGAPYVLEVQSFLEDPESPRTARVFFPVIAVLTDDFLVSRATDLDALRFDLPVLERTVAPAYRVALPLDPANTRERYVVVFTPAQLVEARGVAIEVPEQAARAATAAWLGASAFGRLRITLRPAPAEAPRAPDEAPAADAPPPVSTAP